MDHFSDWLNSSELGRYLLEREQSFYARMVDDVFGFHAVQLGLPHYDFLPECRISWRACVCESGPASIQAEPARLPFARRSIDLLVMPHTLDFSSEPHQVLSEVKRVLVPEGRLVLTGFNPYSLWGARRLLRRRKGSPWNGQFLSLSRIKDWLKLLDLDLEEGSFICYAPPFVHEEWLQRCRFMEKAGDRWWPLAAGVYGIKAVKKVRGVRLLTPEWKKKKALAQQLAPAGDHRSQCGGREDKHSGNDSQRKS